MFKNILVPVSSEYYPKQVIQRCIYFSNKFKSKINLVYIIEEKTFNLVDKEIDSFRTHFEIEEMKKDFQNKQRQTAKEIILKDAEQLFKEKKVNFSTKIIKGEFSEVIKREIDFYTYDLILMGFEKECSLNYRLFEEVTLPIWIEARSDKNIILAVCSNLSPNVKAPEIGNNLAKSLNLEFQIIYVIDKEDLVQVDEDLQRSDKKTEDYIAINAQKFIEENKKKGIKIELVKGSLEKEVIKAAEKFDPGLVIIGREQKKKGLLGLPVKNLKRKLAEKCDYSLLFIN